MTDHTTTSILQRLRACSPRRGLSFDHALKVAEHQAALLLRLTDATDAPIPTQILSDIPRIELGVDHRLETSGVSFWNGSVWKLIARGGEHPNRQRFSLFHELKHVIDHPVRELLYGSEYVRERTADRFAACVLMPKLHVTRAWCSGIQDQHDLARHFAVSPEAMRRRLQELGLGGPIDIPVYRCDRGLRTAPRFAIAGVEPGGTP